nr:uncharacterized protein LOC126519867 [Dermacentor andersoni]
MMQNGRDDEDGQRERGSSDSESEPFLSERVMEFRLKMAQERRRSLALELELARARTTSPSSGRDGSGSALENDRNTEWRKYSKLLVGAFPKFPTDAEVPIWFESVEHTLEAYEVPRSCWGQIVFPLLAERIEYLSTRLTPAQHRDYEALKEVVLDELQLSPLEYQKRFFGVRKRKTETWKSFTTRLASYLNFYVASRDVSNFAELLELLVADQLKTVLSEEALRYVRLREGAGWYKASEIARLLQTFEDAHGRGDLPKGQPRGAGSKGPEITIENRSSSGLVSHQGQRTKPKSPCPPAGQQRPTICFECGSAGHIRPNCPRIRERLAQTAAQQEQPERLTARVALENPAAGDRLLCVALNCRGRTMKAIVDTGAEITVVRESAVPPELAQSHGSVGLRAAFGERVEAKLVALPLTLKQGQPVFSKVEEATPVLCALTDRLSVSADCLLSAEDWSALQQGRDEACEPPTKKLPRSSSEELVTAVGLDGGQVNPENPVSVASKADALHSNEEGAQEESNRSSDTVKGDAGTLREEQKSDATLSRAWKNAEEGKGGMIVIDGLLYHRDHVLGQPVKQLVLPTTRRAEVLSLAHESCWGGHLGCRKTRARIKLSFFWPGVEKDVQAFCNSCHGCQIRADKRQSDRVPITPLVRPQYPFQKVNLDVIGPIDPPSSRGHRYALCIIDLCSRWPEVVCLTSLTAKATCDAMLGVFSRTGIPEVVCSDCGTNFTASVTNEFLSRLGCSRRFSTPDHPESNGAVERWNRVFKNMLFHVISKQGREWDKFVPFLLWAYREVLHDTTGVSPFRMMYGREPVGPLAILKRTWSGEQEVPALVADRPSQYMQKLKKQLQIAAEAADLTTTNQQRTYATQYNLRTKEKAFQVGDQVLAFDSNRLGRMYPKWLGPCTVKEKYRQHSYYIETPEGRRMLVHANHLRPYTSRVASIGVIFHDDREFGEVEYTPRPGRVLGTTALLPADSISHLEPPERALVNEVFQTHAALFTAEIGIARVNEHRIKLMEGAAPKRCRPYRIPVALKSEVSKQISELLELGLIYRCESPFAHPLVCVPKKDGTVRLCVDYRSLNAMTEPDAFPMGFPQDLIMNVGQASHITLIDLRRGYWQVPLAEDSQRAAAFVSHLGQFAWRVMPFGLRNAAASFQRSMNQLLAPHEDYACAYLDDIAVFSKSIQEHIRHLHAVFSALTSVGLVANLEKCQVARGSIRYLGHVVGSGKHGPDPTKLAAIKGLQVPRTKKELRSVLGLCGYYRGYISNFAAIAKPLTQMTAKHISNRIPWSPEANEAFEGLKGALCSAVELATPDSSKPFWLFTDASAIAVGACLAQMTDNGTECPIAFASHRFTPTQMRWSTIEREAFGVIWGLKKFDTWVFGTKIFVVSDHNPLAYLTQSTPQGAKLTRWALALQRYDVVVQHRKGIAHTNADALSRLTNHCWEKDVKDREPAVTDSGGEGTSVV